MRSKIDKKDLISSLLMLSLATLLIVKLIPSFITKPEQEIQKPTEVTQKDNLPQQKDVDAPAQQDFSIETVTLPAPPPIAEVQSALVEKTTKPVPVNEPHTKTVKALSKTKTVTENAQEKVRALSEKPTPQERASKTIKTIAVVKENLEISEPIEEITETKPLPEQQISFLEPSVSKEDLENLKQQPVKVLEDPVKTESIASRAVVTASLKNRKAVQEGRSLLKVLEHGQGPNIEIAWPNSGSSREKLYQHLTQCYGMVTSVLDEADFYKANHRGVWTFNPDLYSGFMRQPAGKLPHAEQRQLSQIKNQQGLSYSAIPVRLFPRQADAILLGGLNQLIGQSYKTAKTIHGAYQLQNGNLSIQDIYVDGVYVKGTIQLISTSRNCGV